MQYSIRAFFKGVTPFAVALSLLPATLFARNEKQDEATHQKTRDTVMQLKEKDTMIVRQLDESRVTAVAKPSPTLQSAPVQVVDRTVIERLGAQELHEAVKNLAGVNIRDYGGIGGIKTVSIRSLGAQHTAVSYDGIAVSDIQSGQVDIGRFSLDNVEMITLSIGQSDEIFKSARMFASAGTLDITSSRPVFGDCGTNVIARMKAGSFGTYNPSLLLEHRLGSRWALGANADWVTSKGDYPFIIDNGRESELLLRKNSDVNTLRAEINLWGFIGASGKFSLKASGLSGERGLPGSVVLYNQDAFERLWDKNGFVQASYNTALGVKWDLNGVLKYNYSRSKYYDESQRYPLGFVEDLYTQEEYYGSIATRFKPAKGVELTFAQDLFYNTLDASIPECPFPERMNSLTTLAGKYQGSSVTVVASLTNTYISEKVQKGDPAPDRNNLSPALSISWKPFKATNLRVRASYKRGFRAPTFNDLYYLRVGNTNLKPERADQYNLGLTWSGTLGKEESGWLSATLDGYYNNVEDKIVARPTLFIWKMMNIGKVRIAGADLSVTSSVRLGNDHNLILSTNASYQHAVDISDPESKTWRHQIPYTPRISGATNLAWSNPWLNLSYIISFVGDKYSLPLNVERNLIKGYAEHTISAYRDFRIHGVFLRLQGEMINFTNKMYDIIQYYPMPGRNFRLTLKIKI
jgi:outer membrane cobalamin receptor